MSALTAAAALATLLDEAPAWLPNVDHWEVAENDGEWSVSGQLAGQLGESHAFSLLRPIVEATGMRIEDDGQLVKAPFVLDDAACFIWYLRPVKRWVVPEQCATCPTKLGASEVSFVRLGAAGADAPVICVPCRDRMHGRWIKGDAARDAEVLRDAAETVELMNVGCSQRNCVVCDAREDVAVCLREKADEVGKVTRDAGEITQPADTTPLVVRWDRPVLPPSGEDDHTIVACTSEDGRPVALLLDAEHRAALADELADSDDAQALLVEVRRRGEITSGAAHRWLGACSNVPAPRARARALLRRLAERGELVVREERGRRTYAANDAGGDR